MKNIENRLNKLETKNGKNQLEIINLDISIMTDEELNNLDRHNKIYRYSIESLQNRLENIQNGNLISALGV